jgi:mono/diheme cytochrome c family protein
LGRKLLKWMLIALLGLLVAACSDLAGEVEIVATLPPPTGMIPMQQQQEADAEGANPLPATSPDVQNGQRIYAENCVSCHGTNGAGNGALVESGEVPRMSSFLEATHMRQQSPEYYYDIITNGNLVNLMPPWRGSLSVQERWDVAMYAYTLHYDDEQIARGADLVSDEPAPDFSLLSDAERAVASDYDGDEAWAAVAYQRVQTLANFETRFDVAATPEPLASVTIVGTVTNGTEGASVPDDLAVTLIYGADQTLETVDMQLDDNQQFRFEDIPVEQNYAYAVVAVQNNTRFISDVLTAADIQAETDLSLSIYERTDDMEAITLTDARFTVEQLTVESLGTGLVFSQINTYENTSDRVFYLTPDEQSFSISLAVDLPVGAQILVPRDNPRFLTFQEQYLLVDTNPVFPGEHTIEMVYFIPYDTGAVVDIPQRTQLEGDVTINMVTRQLTVASDVITQVATRPATENSAAMDVYRGTYRVPAGQSLIFEIDGALQPSVATNEDAGVITADRLLPALVIGVGFLLVLIGGVVFVVNRDTDDAAPASGDAPAELSAVELDKAINRLLREIGTLENQHESGEINHDVFQRKRAELRAQLADLMAQKKRTPEA